MTKDSLHEIEFKWTVTDPGQHHVFLEELKKLGAQLNAPQKNFIEDSYLDTEDRLFTMNRTSCRLRNSNNHWELTMKILTPLKKGLAKRREKTYSLPDLNSYTAALRYTKNRLLKSMLKGRDIERLFEIKNDRVCRILALPDSTKMEVSSDDFSISRNSKVVSLHEIELEFMEGDINSFLSFTKKITMSSNLRPASTSKVETALNEFSLNVTKTVSGEYFFSKSDSTPSATRQITKKYIESLRDNEPIVRIGIDEEGAHDMRVASRRLRTAIKVMKDVMPDYANHIYKDLSWLGRALGRVRDLQLHLIYITETEENLPLEYKKALKKYKASIYKNIDDNYKRLLAVLNSKRYSSLLKKLDLLSKHENPNLRESSIDSAKRLISKTAGKIISNTSEINNMTSDEELHRLRLSVKRLRYICEFFIPIFKAKMKRHIKKTREMQDLLGGNQDALVLIQELSSVLDNKELIGNNNNLKEAINKIIEIKKEESLKLRKSFFKVWGKYKRKTLMDLLYEVI